MNIIGYTSPGLSNAVPLNTITHVILERVKVTSVSPVTLTNDQGWTDANVAALISRCHAVGVKVLMEIFNSYGTSSNDTIFNNSAQSLALINKIMDLVNYHGFDGVDLDWESETMNNTNYSNFIVSLKARLGSLELCTFVPARKKLFNAAAIAAFDFIDVGTYDYPSMTDPYWYVTTTQAQTHMEWWATTVPVVPRSKLCLSISFAARSPWTPYNAIVTASTPTTDNAVSGYRYNGLDTVKAKATLVKSSGYGGIMVYVLNMDTYSIPSRSLLTGITSILNDTLPSPPPLPPTIHKLTVTVTGLGTTIPAVGTYNIPAGQTITMTAIPAAGYRFRTWSWPSNPDPAYSGWQENPTSWTMVNPVSIVAIFDPLTSPPPTPGTETNNLIIGGLTLLTVIGIMAQKK